MTIHDFLNIRWEDDGLPLIEPARTSPVLADPTVLFPSETPNGNWVLFAHTVWGIHRYESEDGVSWVDRGMAVRNAMRPFCRRVDGAFNLSYEKYRPFAVVAQILPRPPRWRSRLEMRSSPDLVHWSGARPLLASEPEWAVDAELGTSVSNPCLVPLPTTHDQPNAFRLYFSASLAYVPDCGFSEPRYIGCADGASPDGPFTARPHPVIDPVDDDLPGVLAPSDGWRASHVYACDCRQAPDGTWYLYYNARDGWYKAQGTERIGRLVGRV